MPFGGTTPEQDKKIDKCVKDLVAKGKEKKNAIAICKSSVLGKKKQDSKPNIIENVSLSLQAPITIVESVQNDENTQKIKGMALPAQESRNGRVYSIEDIKEAKFAGKVFTEGKELLIGLNHSEDVTDNVGKWNPMFEDNGISYSGVVFNTGKHPYMIDSVRKGLMPFVSIEAMADLVSEDDKVFAKNLDILGMDFVKHPGMPDASVGMAEAFDKAIENVDVKEIGDEMTKEEVKVVEEEETTEEQPKEEPKKEEKAEPKVEEPSEIDKVFEKLDEQSKTVEELSKEIKELKEKPKSKGVVTESDKPTMNVIMEKGKKGMDIYSEDILY